MKKLLIICLLVLSNISNADVVLGRDGIWYGNICMNQMGWEIVPFQPVGSMCLLPRSRTYGVIINR